MGQSAREKMEALKRALKVETREIGSKGQRVVAVVIPAEWSLKDGPKALAEKFSAERRSTLEFKDSETKVRQDGAMVFLFEGKAPYCGKCLGEEGYRGALERYLRAKAPALFALKERTNGEAA